MLTKREAAKYPFLSDTGDLVKKLELSINPIATPDIVERGTERIVEAILEGEVSSGFENSVVELLSFPLSMMMVASIKDKYLIRRYALSEAKRMGKLLSKENLYRLRQITKNELEWRVKEKELIFGYFHTETTRNFEFLMHFIDYLSQATSFHEDKWKLINKNLYNGWVPITKAELARLIQQRIESTIKQTLLELEPTIPDSLRGKIDEINKILEEHKPVTTDGFPKDISFQAFPPCIKKILKKIDDLTNLSHSERFCLTTFLLNIGMESENILDLYSEFPDFDRKYTKYQIEHIGGVKGGTKYTPPSCATLKQQNICFKPDGLCAKVKHPLGYYSFLSRK